MLTARRIAPGPTVPVLKIRAFLSEIEKLGGDRSAVMRHIGLDELPKDPYARVPFAAYRGIWSWLEANDPDGTIGLRLGERMGLGTMDAVDYAIAAANTLRDYFELAKRYVRLLNANRVVRTREVPEGVWLELVSRIEALEDAALMSEFAVANSITKARQAVGAQLIPRRVLFRHPRPRNTDEHRRIFGVEPEFLAGMNALLFALEDLSRPLTAANPGLNAVLDRIVRDLAAKLPATDSISEAARAALASQLAHGGTLASTAKALHMSPRTLQRRLMEESGEPFEQLRDRLRKHLALPAVASGVPNLEVALRVGYAEVRSFERAFKRWTGKSPAEFRRALGEGEPSN